MPRFIPYSWEFNCWPVKSIVKFQAQTILAFTTAASNQRGKHDVWTWSLRYAHDSSIQRPKRPNYVASVIPTGREVRRGTSYGSGSMHTERNNNKQLARSLPLPLSLPPLAPTMIHKQSANWAATCRSTGKRSEETAAIGVEANKDQIIGLCSQSETQILTLLIARDRRCHENTQIRVPPPPTTNY